MLLTSAKRQDPCAGATMRDDDHAYQKQRHDVRVKDIRDLAEDKTQIQRLLSSPHVHLLSCARVYLSVLTVNLQYWYERREVEVLCIMLLQHSFSHITEVERCLYRNVSGTCQFLSKHSSSTIAM